MPVVSVPEDRVAVGVDLGGTNLTGLLVRGDGEILGRRRRPTPRTGGAEAVLAAVRETAENLLGQAAASGTVVAGLGFGIPGPIDTERGVCLFSPNLGWRDLDVAGYFRRAFNLPVAVDNDVRAATLGEAWLGAGRPYRTFVCLTLGTGIGSGLVLDGRLWRGPGFSAGELGHIPVDTRPDAPLCGCGRRGCLESLASGTAIAREAGTAGAREAAEAARRGDPACRRVFERAAAYLGVGIATVVTLLNPEAVIVGGRVAGAWDLLGPIVQRVVDERTFPPNRASLRGILPAALGEDAGAVGAAGLVLLPGGGPAGVR